MYRCLLIDHDDTCVDSTRHIHYPAHLEILKLLRPGLEPQGLEHWFEKNFNPGVYDYYTGELAFSPAEMDEEFRIWRSFTRSRIPGFFPGIIDLLKEFRTRGGKIAVISHSEEAHILRDYREGGEGFLPDLVFGWEDDLTRRKPSPWPAEEAIRRLGADPAMTAVLDDLLPGVEMAQAAGVDAIGAGWGHRIPSIEAGMRHRCRNYFYRVEDLRAFLFSN